MILIKSAKAWAYVPTGKLNGGRDEYKFLWCNVQSVNLLTRRAFITYIKPETGAKTTIQMTMGENCKVLYGTGLFTKDKEGNEVEIYYGDVVYFKANYTTKPRGRQLAVVSYDGYKIVLRNTSGSYDASEETEEFPYTVKIMGNCYDDQTAFKGLYESNEQ